MCRLFGFRSGAPSAVHHSLLRANNALIKQSREHPDGWGIGWWDDVLHTPQLRRGASAAFAEADFTRFASVVSASSVLAHVRKASVGEVCLPNTHPFRHGRYLFAHNGTIAQFAAARARLEEAAAPAFRERIQGDTDSERCFAIFLTKLSERTSLEEPARFEDVALALAQTVTIVEAIADAGAPERSSTTFLVGDGKLLLAFRRGRTLHYSTYKNACGERETCPRLSPECEAPPDLGGGRVNHCIIASEKISTEDVWFEVGEDELVGVDEAMKLRRATLEELLAVRAAPVAS